MKDHSNKGLETIIKLRHLSSAINSDWEMLRNVKGAVEAIIAEADVLMDAHGSPESKALYSADKATLNRQINHIQEMLDEFYGFITRGEKMESDQLYASFRDHVRSVAGLFAKIGGYGDKAFSGFSGQDWQGIWNVLQSNVSLVQGLGEAAYIKAKMMENFRAEEIDELTRKISRHIPPSFNLLEAEKYREEYLQAMKEMEEEANKKDNLWDRFLNFLAGNIPFEQTPEERVMMRRWLEGERGEL